MLDRRVNELTEGRGADVVIEVVGLSPALKMGLELLRPRGMISSVGVHNGEVPWTGNQAYGKNLRIQMGRCPVRSIFSQASEKLKQKQHLLSFMSDKVMPMSQAVEGDDLFDKMKVQKDCKSYRRRWTTVGICLPELSQGAWLVCKQVTGEYWSDRDMGPDDVKEKTLVQCGQVEQG
ncbi:MAG: hypothetical protein Q9179_001522 [Wetmoreana sp. 5 TL-2023]